MADPQAHVTFGSYPDAIRANLVWTTGITPSRCIMEVVARTGAPTGSHRYGPLDWSYDGESFSLADCIVEHATLVKHGEPSEYYTWRLVILDRRWRWRHGEISGRYNVLLPDGSIDAETEKTPRELIELCLEAMNEDQPIISEYTPEELRPFCEWDHTNPARALDDVCKQCGLVVTLNLDNIVHIWRIGDGEDLPMAGPKYRHERYPIDAMIRPEFVQILGAPTRYQSWLKLEAVGLDTDGQIRKINDLSYKPANGWEYECPWVFAGVDYYTQGLDGYYHYNQGLAFQTVWRWYMVTAQCDGELNLPNVDVEITDIRQILPLLPDLVEPRRYPDKLALNPFTVDQRSRRPYVDGIFWAETLVDINTNEYTGSSIYQTFDYLGPYEIDLENGLVRFEKPVFKVTSGLRYPADMYLMAAYHIQDKWASKPVRYQRERQLDVSTLLGVHRGGTRVVSQPDIQETVIMQYPGGLPRTPGDPITNTEAMEELADGYLDAVLREYDRTPQESMEYAGLVLRDLDGKVRQLELSCGGRDHLPMVTKLSLYCESDIFSPSEAERRRTEAVEGIVEAAK